MDGKVIAWCMKCASQREMVNPQPRLLKSNRMCITGKCIVCGMTMNKLTKKPKVTVVDEAEETDKVEVVEVKKAPAVRWFAQCRKCNAEREILDAEYVGELWTHKLVIRGKCSACGLFANMISARKEVAKEAEDGKDSAQTEGTVEVKHG